MVHVISKRLFRELIFTNCIIIGKYSIGIFAVAVYTLHIPTYTCFIHQNVWETMHFKGNISIFENISSSGLRYRLFFKKVMIFHFPM